MRWIFQKELRIARERGILDNTLFIKNLSAEDFLILLNNSKCIVGNSSVGIRESSYLGVPSVNIGKRQNGREKAKNVLQSNHTSTEILKSINYQIKKMKYKKSYLYGNGQSGNKIIKIISKLKIKNTQKKVFYGNK